MTLTSCLKIDSIIFKYAKTRPIFRYYIYLALLTKSFRKMKATMVLIEGTNLGKKMGRYLNRKPSCQRLNQDHSDKQIQQLSQIK